MARLSKARLLDRVLEGVRSSGWTGLVLHNQHPFLVRAIRRDESVALRIYIWNITTGGPGTVRPPDERRIQITGVDPPLTITSDARTLLLGWHEGLQVFAGYDVVRHRKFGWSASLQVREATLEEAAQRGIAAQQRTSQDIVVAFAPDQLMNYASRHPQLHRFQGGAELEMLEIAARGEDVPEDELDVVPMPRQAVVRSVQQWSRQRSFRGRVLSAYREQCAVCNLQLDLVEAAHIIPIGYPESNDLTANGLCLCPLHHDAYDDALVGVWPDYHIRVNDTKLDELVARGLGTGETNLRAFECNTILLPAQQADHPRPDYLQEGLKVRGWSI